MIDSLREDGYIFEHPARLSDSDIEILLIIEQEAFPIDYYNREQLLEEYQNDPYLFIVARDKQISPVGYISGDITEGVGKVMSVAVEKSLRGRGIGSSLVGLMVDHFKTRSIHILEAYTRVDNIASAIILERFGFVVVDMVEDYYRDKSPALLFRAKPDY